MNPYDILELQPGAANAAVIQAVARAMKAKRHEPRAIAEAQRALLNTEQRCLADFLLPAIPAPRRFVPPDQEPTVSPLPAWPEADPSLLAAALGAIVEEDRRLAGSLAEDLGTPAPLPAYPQRILEIEAPPR